MATPKRERIGEPYHIRWNDAASGGAGWHPPEENRNALQPAETLGFLVKSAKKYVVVAQSKDVRGNITDTIAIPRSTIQRMKRLRL